MFKNSFCSELLLELFIHMLQFTYLRIKIIIHVLQFTYLKIKIIFSGIWQ